ncbi:MAG: MgtC/SapB family protein [Rhodospirillaceae bacterium]
MEHQTLTDIAASFWSASVIQDNLVICLHVFGALLLGIVVGYERTWSGRAAGMRTYGFVCMAAAALTVVVGHPASWYGGHPGEGGGDPTRVIQGIVTGVGFLGAGVIMREGFTITGLTTAASIWTVSVIGIVVGLGFYATAILLTLLATAGMVVLRRVEKLLPSHSELAVRLRFARGTAIDTAEVRSIVAGLGYEVLDATVVISLDAGAVEWHFLAATRDRRAVTAEDFAQQIGLTPGIKTLQVSHARN